MTIFDPASSQMWVYNGTSWIPISVNNPKHCVVCGSLSHEIENINGKLMIPDHPFCEDNLQYLEWQVEKRERQVRQST